MALPKQSYSTPYLYSICTSSEFDSNILKLLIQKGADLHCKYDGQSVFMKCKNSSHGDLDSCEKFKIYRNALIQELSDMFKFTDYDEFKRRVIESIEDEEIILLESIHVKALNELRNGYVDLEEALNHLKSFEFRERLFVDYIDVLKSHKKLLEVRKNRFAKNFPEVAKVNKQKRENNQNKTHYLKIQELISDELFDHLIVSDDSQEQKTDELTKIFKSFNNYIAVIEEKLKHGYELQTFLETQLK